MKNVYIKNINQEEVITLANEIEVLQGQVVSKTLAQNPAVSITLFAFDKGEEISSHDSSGDAMVTVLEGTGRFTVDGKDYLLHANETLIMPAKKPHAVYAQETFKMMLVVVFPQ
ncbi:cupin domain-containing protein [Aminipila sp.]|jgi:quercetin dioxygenase-like cupin family protein|uniref:cupin domain-containing protein n=1 Tax=Aminipila sp. TaxID=2060095 RepID=UPI001D2C538E|nr:cupin domain-containing protein [Aminipila sp.]MBE6033968.1 cupin domain-containing protein [Clostridiales bacterium]